ncbi:MAG: hypothetical protein ACI9U0_000824 [Flavobacteriales bacterium]|jgi:hypothetical protein
MLYLPKRRNLKNFKRKSICRFPSVKGDVPVVRTEGVLEKDFCYHLEFDPLVIQYQCQPLGYYYYLNNEKLGYTPDFEVEIDGGAETYYEIKERKYIKEGFETEFKAKQQQAKILGKELILVYDDFIRQEPKLTNLKRVYGAKRRGLPSRELVKLIKEVFPKQQSIIAEDLMQYTGLTIGQVYQLIYYKEIIADFDKTFGPEMKLWRG